MLALLQALRADPATYFAGLPKDILESCIGFYAVGPTVGSPSHERSPAYFDGDRLATSGKNSRHPRHWVSNSAGHQFWLVGLMPYVSYQYQEEPKRVLGLLDELLSRQIVTALLVDNRYAIIYRNQTVQYWTITGQTWTTPLTPLSQANHFQLLGAVWHSRRFVSHLPSQGLDVVAEGHRLECYVHGTNKCLLTHTFVSGPILALTVDRQQIAVAVAMPTVAQAAALELPDGTRTVLAQFRRNGWTVLVIKSQLIIVNGTVSLNGWRTAGGLDEEIRLIALSDDKFVAVPWHSRDVWSWQADPQLK